MWGGSAEKFRQKSTLEQISQLCEELLFQASLCWLQVHFTINFKIVKFVFKALHKSAPKYISDLVNIYGQLNSYSLSSPRSRQK